MSPKITEQLLREIDHGINNGEERVRYRFLGRMGTMNSMEYTEQLKESVGAFYSQPDQESLQNVLSLIFDGIRENHLVSVAYAVDKKTHNGFFFYRRDYSDGSQTAYVFTEEADYRKNHTISLPLRAVLDEILSNGAYKGIRINPFKENVFISSRLVKAAIDMGSLMETEKAEDEEKSHPQRDTKHEIRCKRPLSEEQFAQIAERIKQFDTNTEDYLKICFLNDENTLYAQVFRSDDARYRHLCFGLNMSEFSVKTPMPDWKSMRTGEALDLLHRVCTSTDFVFRDEFIYDFEEYCARLRGEDRA